MIKLSSSDWSISMRGKHMALCVCTSIWLLGCQPAAPADCWSDLIEWHDQLYALHQMGALDTTKARRAREQLQLALKRCPADVRLAETASVVSAGVDSYLTLLDIAVMADDAAMTRALAQRVMSNDDLLPPAQTLDFGGQFLQVGAYFESADAVMALLELGWHPNAADENGVTALHVGTAQTTNGLITTRHLVAYGGDPNRRSGNNVTPMMLARMQGDLDKALCLFQLGAAPPQEYEYDGFSIDESRRENVRLVDEFFNSAQITIPEHIESSCTL